MPSTVPSRTFKVVKVPSAYGITLGLQGEVLDEVEDARVANALLYETWTEDTDPGKTLKYHLEVV